MRRHQKSKTGVSVAPKMDMCPRKILKKKDCSHVIGLCLGLGLCYGVFTLPRSDTYSYIIQKSYTGTGSDTDENQLNSTLSVPM